MSEPYSYPVIRSGRNGRLVVGNKVINKKGKSYLNKEEDRRSQAVLAMMLRLTGSTIKDVKDTLRISTQTVHDRLRQARKDDVLDRAKDAIRDTLLPKALVRYNELVESDNEKVAASVCKHIIEGLGVLAKGATTIESDDDAEETLEIFRAKLRRTVKAKALDSVDSGTVIEAEPPHDDQK